MHLKTNKNFKLYTQILRTTIYGYNMFNNNNNNNNFISYNKTIRDINIYSHHNLSLSHSCIFFATCESNVS